MVKSLSWTNALSAKEQMYCTSQAYTNNYTSNEFYFLQWCAICGHRYSMICWQNAILSDILCATTSYALNISILYIFFASRNVKHVIILIAQINYVLLMLALLLVRHFFNNVVSSVISWPLWLFWYVNMFLYAFNKFYLLISWDFWDISNFLIFDDFRLKFMIFYAYW